MALTCRGPCPSPWRLPAICPYPCWERRRSPPPRQTRACRGPFPCSCLHLCPYLCLWLCLFPCPCPCLCPCPCPCPCHYICPSPCLYPWARCCPRPRWTPSACPCRHLSYPCRHLPRSRSPARQA